MNTHLVKLFLAVVMIIGFSPTHQAQAESNCEAGVNFFMGEEVYITQIVMGVNGKAQTTIWSIDGNCAVVDQELLVMVPYTYQGVPLIHDIRPIPATDYIAENSQWWGYKKLSNDGYLYHTYDFPLGVLGYNSQVTGYLINLPYTPSPADREITRLYQLANRRVPAPDFFSPVDKANWLLNHWYYAFPQYPEGFDLVCTMARSVCYHSRQYKLIAKYGGEMSIDYRTITFKSLPDAAYISDIRHGYEPDRFVYIHPNPLSPMGYDDIPEKFPVIWLTK